MFFSFLWDCFSKYQYHFIALMVVIICGRKLSHIIETSILYMHVRMQEIHNTKNIWYLHQFLSMVLLVFKQIHNEKCLEKEVEANIQGEQLVKCLFFQGQFKYVLQAQIFMIVLTLLKYSFCLGETTIKPNIPRSKLNKNQHM